MSRGTSVLVSPPATENPEPSAPEPPPRARILKAARDLFYHHGIHSVGVDAIAAAAGTNKMTLYRHFGSKDELVCECLREMGASIDGAWAEIEHEYEHDPKGQLLAWLRFMGEIKLGRNARGCAFANAAVQLSDEAHPARRVIEERKSRYRAKCLDLCRRAGLRDPELLADELFLLSEGAQVSLQCVGREGPAARLIEMFERLVEAHAPRN
jgi:AcrR family transcriptional regulator